MHVLRPGIGARTLLLAAHPDDEAIGASTLIAPPVEPDHRPCDRCARITCRMPRSMGLTAVRHTPMRDGTRFLAALHAAGAPDVRLVELGVNGPASRRTTWSIFTARLLPLVEEADQVMTHPYEGGHPDHDACAFAARAAVRSSAERSETDGVHFVSRGLHRLDCVRVSGRHFRTS